LWLCAYTSPTLWYSATAGKLHPNINLDDPEDVVDTSILVGPQAEEVDVKARTNCYALLCTVDPCNSTTWGPGTCQPEILRTHPPAIALLPVILCPACWCLLCFLAAVESHTDCWAEVWGSASQVALSNSFGFGGHNSCVLFRKFEG
jgi:hypothetical protein